MSRYLEAHLVDGDTRLRLFPDGRCQWCGKELPRRCKSYCPGERVGSGAGFYIFRRCWANFWEYWYKRPRYQRLILLRDNFTCQLCGIRPLVLSAADGVERPDLSRLHVDHIVPYSKVRKTDLENLQVLCARCNLTKGAKVLEAKQAVLL